MSFPIAICVVTHMYPDDLEQYADMWKHMRPHRAFFRDCSRATIALFDAMCRGAPPPSCQLTQVHGATVIHFHVFHHIEKELDRKQKGERFTRADEDPWFENMYGRTCQLRRHTWFEVFERAIRRCADAIPHQDVARHVLFFDEEIVPTTHGDWTHLVRDFYRDAQMLVLGEAYATQRWDTLRSLGRPAALRPADECVFPNVFLVHGASLPALRGVLDSCAQQDMVLPNIMERVRVTEVHPPPFRSMDEYLADKHATRAYESIEEALWDMDPRVECPPSSPCRQIHQIWFGRPMPDRITRLHQDMKRIHGAENVTLWRNEDVPGLPRTTLFARTATSYAMLADLARLEILYLHGGIYADMDMQVIKDMRPLFTLPITLTRDFVRQDDRRTTVTNSIIGAHRHQLYILKMLSYYKRSLCVDGEYISVLTAGPNLVQKLYQSIAHAVHPRGGHAIVSCLPSSHFYGNDFKNHEAKRGECFGRHLFFGSWRR